MLKLNDIVVRAFDVSKRMVHGEVDLPTKVGSQFFDFTFYVMEIRPAYSCLLRRPWIHGAGAYFYFTPKVEVSRKRKNHYSLWRRRIHGDPFELLRVC